jgi:hypothetical protein
MINTNLARRLQELEDFVLPTNAPQVYVRIHSISAEAKVVKTVVVRIECGPPYKGPTGPTAPRDNSLPIIRIDMLIKSKRVDYKGC